MVRFFFRFRKRGGKHHSFHHSFFFGHTSDVAVTKSQVKLHQVNQAPVWKAAKQKLKIQI